MILNKTLKLFYSHKYIQIILQIICCTYYTISFTLNCLDRISLAVVSNFLRPQNTKCLLYITHEQIILLFIVQERERDASITKSRSTSTAKDQTSITKHDDMRTLEDVDILTLKDDNMQTVKDDNIPTVKNDNIPTVKNDNIQTVKNDVVPTVKDDVVPTNTQTDDFVTISNDSKPKTETDGILSRQSRKVAPELPITARFVHF